MRSSKVLQVPEPVALVVPVRAQVLRLVPAQVRVPRALARLPVQQLRAVLALLVRLRASRLQRVRLRPLPAAATTTAFDRSINDFEKAASAAFFFAASGWVFVAAIVMRRRLPLMGSYDARIATYVSLAEERG